MSPDFVTVILTLTWDQSFLSWIFTLNKKPEFFCLKPIVQDGSFTEWVEENRKAEGQVKKGYVG